EKKAFYLVPGGQSDWERVEQLYQKKPAQGLIVQNVELIWNEAIEKNFHSGLKLLEQRWGKGAFAPTWGGSEARKKVHEELLKDTKSSATYSHVGILACFHGT